jgi:hypothetical protein
MLQLSFMPGYTFLSNDLFTDMKIHMGFTHLQTDRPEIITRLSMEAL